MCEATRLPLPYLCHTVLDLSPFSHYGLGCFMLFSGRLLKFILTLCLCSIQNRFLIALSVKNVEQSECSG
jgi:hypothetical protein